MKENKSLIKNLFYIASTLAITSCATMFNSGSQSLVANSSDGSEVAVIVTTSSGSYKTKLPATIVTAPSSFADTTIKVVDVCYNQTELTVKKSITPSFFANILFGLASPIGFAIDYADGTMWKMDRNVIVPLDKKKNSSCK